jgi:hypothetical protein
MNNERTTNHKFTRMNIKTTKSTLGFLGLLAFTALALLVPFGTHAADLDEDGLDDAVEQMLLDRHRPQYVFEDDERHWPISAERLVRGSRLRWNTHPDRDFEYPWLVDVWKPNWPLTRVLSFAVVQRGPASLRTLTSVPTATSGISTSMTTCEAE